MLKREGEFRWTREGWFEGGSLGKESVYLTKGGEQRSGEEDKSEVESPFGEFFFLFLFEMKKLLFF